MLKKLILCGAFFSSSLLAHADQIKETNIASEQSCDDFTNVTIRKLRSKESINLCQFKGRPLLIVNTASNCGFTSQFKGLEALYQKYQEQGLVILGFPSDDFFQEEDDEKETAKVCYINYGVTFPMFATSEVRGSDANPIFKYLNEQTSSPNWNFYKYVVSADRSTVQRFNSKTKPNSEKLTKAIEQAISKI
ncbi:MULTISPECIES: glutathione peroxidase [unclassified Pseudoalteromonas]|uniref:glutathione peroxidase n=1 Tax=unclassified Pseudoalteromonas TaxID=194690 RepID=UPI0025B3BB06|nr:MULTISPECIES: glutathione peroxidase [unclassified Pseudoalteromonas]MDN3379707.1 glutathione peroxidase [Pseudoalteromonas sp. APC 3893]MDN3388047.1 glutathione peroxidase [Pseudoalteromonas sp. APC 4017]